MIFHTLFLRVPFCDSKLWSSKNIILTRRKRLSKNKREDELTYDNKEKHYLLSQGHKTVIQVVVLFKGKSLNMNFK